MDRGAVHDVAPTCADWPNRFREIVDLWEPDEVVLLIGAWDAYDVRMDGEWVEFGTPRHDEFVLDEVRQAVDLLRSHGAQVVLLTTPYFEPRRDIVDRDRTAYNPTRVDHLNALLRQVEGVALFDLNGFLDPEGHYTSAALDVADAARRRRALHRRRRGPRRALASATARGARRVPSGCEGVLAHCKQVVDT